MSDVTVKKCDVCGAIKGVTNHWYKHFEYDDTLTIGNSTSWLSTKMLDACSESCLVSVLHQWLLKQTETRT